MTLSPSTPKSTVHRLATVSAGTVGLGERGLPKGTNIIDPVFWDQYDNTTLIYDTVWSAKRQQLRIFFPKLFNFKAVMHGARWKVDGQFRKGGRLKQLRVYDSIAIPCENPSAKVELHTPIGHSDIPFSQADPDRYRGRNVLYAQNKDNDLNWVRDWVLAHQRNHGVDAVLLSNNNSETYSSEDLRRTLAALPGIAIADVLDVPLRYGPSPSNATPAGPLKFLQRTLLNIVCHRWLQQARGVLICDIDELVMSASGQSIFEATANSAFKYTSFDGEWRYRAASHGTARHADHVYTQSRPAFCASKYCIVPNSVLGRMSWGVHSLEGISRKVFPRSRDFSFYHCRSISTAWKNPRRRSPMENLQKDPATEEFMKKSFPSSKDADAMS